MTTNATDFVSDGVKTAADSFAKTMQSGIKFQEEAATFLTKTLGRTSDEFRSQWDKMTEDAFPFNKKNVERFQKLFDEQSSRSLDLLRKTFDVSAPTNPTDVYEKTFSLWRSSLDTMRQSAESMAKLNAEMFENWNCTMRKTFEKSGCCNVNGNG